VDFASTHVYGNDKARDVFGTHENIPRTQMVCRAVKKSTNRLPLPLPKHSAHLERIQRQLHE